MYFNIVRNSLRFKQQTRLFSIYSYVHIQNPGAQTKVYEIIYNVNSILYIKFV